MEMDDLEPRHKPMQQTDIANMSIAALRVYIVELEAEISRARQMIGEKEVARSGAESVFKP